MLRMTAIKDNGTTVVLIAGRLTSQHLAELEALCPTTGQQTRFDLSETQNADSESLRWLEAAQRGGASIVGASQYITMLLEKTKTAVREKEECQ